MVQLIFNRQIKQRLYSYHRDSVLDFFFSHYLHRCSLSFIAAHPPPQPSNPLLTYIIIKLLNPKNLREMKYKKETMICQKRKRKKQKERNPLKKWEHELNPEKSLNLISVGLIS
jgi:hypothetical protein